MGSGRMWHCQGCTTSQFCRTPGASWADPDLASNPDRRRIGSCVLGACEERGDPNLLPHPPRVSKPTEEAVMQRRMAQRQAMLEERQKIVAAAEAAAAAAPTSFKPAAPATAVATTAAASSSAPPDAPPLNSWPVRASLHAHMLRLQRHSEFQRAPSKGASSSGVVKCADCAEPIPAEQPSAMCTEQNCDYALCIACQWTHACTHARARTVQSSCPNRCFESRV